MLRNRTIPFGYCMVNGKYALNAAEAETVRKIFALYLDGNSLKAIAENLTVPYHKSKPEWNKNMVCRIIENQKYTGTDRYPQIVETEKFNTAQEVKKSRCKYRANKEKVVDTSEPHSIADYIYQPTEKISRLTNEINRLIDTFSTDDDEIRRLIYKCAEMKYKSIYEERGENNASSHA